MQVAALALGLGILGLTDHVVIGLAPSTRVAVHIGSGHATQTVETDSQGILTFSTECEMPPCTVTFRTIHDGPAATSGGCLWETRRAQ